MYKDGPYSTEVAAALKHATWLDKAILWASPRAGLSRVRARTAAQIALSYEGARSDRRQGGWRTASTAGNAENGPAIVKLRNNARDLYRNNAYAKRATREWSKRVVGTGITPRPDTGSDAVNQIIRDAFESWSKECTSDGRLTFGAAQKLIVSSAFVGGECLIRLWDRRLTDNLAVPFQFQILEPDYLDMSKVMVTDTGYIVQGVDFDQLGRIRGYWLFGSHPGEVVPMTLRGLMSKFIPARDVLHHGEIERPGDARSVSRLAAVMNKLRDIDEYADAEIVRKKIAACLVGFVTQPEGPDGPTGGATVTDASGRRIETFEPGMTMYGSPGSSMTFSNPPDSGDFGTHKKTELREVAVGTDIPYILLDDNLEAVNYSSFRGGLLAYRDAIEEYRWNWLIPQVLDPIYQRVIDALALSGQIPEANYQHEWDPPPFDLLDRAAEAEADRAELQIGKKTWPQLVGEQGNDPARQVAEITKWRPQLEAAGVTFAKATTESQSTTETTGDTNASADTGN